MSQSPAGDSVSHRIAAGLVARAPDSESVRDRARLLLADDLAVAIRGARTPSSRAAREATAPEALVGSSLLEGYGGQLVDRAVDAALVNGVSAHSIELDDVHEPASLHPGTVI